jgi:hypothetical protein
MSHKHKIRTKLQPCNPLPNRCPCGCGSFIVRGAKNNEPFWNYRIARHLPGPKYRPDPWNKDDGTWYGIHEVYYEIHGENLVIDRLSTESTRLVGDSPLGFRFGFTKMMQAFDREILVVDHKCRVIAEEQGDFAAKPVK